MSSLVVMIETLAESAAAALVAQTNSIDAPTNPANRFAFMIVPSFSEPGRLVPKIRIPVVLRASRRPPPQCVVAASADRRTDDHRVMPRFTTVLQLALAEQRSRFAVIRWNFVARIVHPCTFRKAT